VGAEIRNLYEAADYPLMRRTKRSEYDGFSESVTRFDKQLPRLIVPLQLYEGVHTISASGGRRRQALTRQFSVEQFLFEK